MIAELLHDLSLHTWHFLRDAPFHVREETVTETLMVRMTRSPVPVAILKSTTAQEAEEGLDWAMAIRTDGRWFIAYVQAKNLFGTKFGVYRDLRSAASESQARKLIHTSNLDNTTPLYAFFNKEVSPYQEGSSVSLAGCAHRYLERGPGVPFRDGQSPLGVTLAHAEDVLERLIPPPAPNQRASTANRYTMPWECLFCPTWKNKDGSTRSKVAKVARLAREVNKPESEAGQRQPDPPPWVALVQQGLGPAEAADEAPLASYYIVVDADAA